MTHLSPHPPPPPPPKASQQDWLVHLVALVLEWLQSYYTILHQAKEEESNSAADSSLDATDSEPSYLDCEFLIHASFKDTYLKQIFFVDSSIFSNYNDISDNLVSAVSQITGCV